MNTCPCCTQPADAPFRRSVNGKIVAGCVDAFHNGELIAPSASNEWHMRAESVEIRRAAKIRLAKVLAS